MYFLDICHGFVQADCILQMLSSQKLIQPTCSISIPCEDSGAIISLHQVNLGVSSQLFWKITEHKLQKITTQYAQTVGQLGLTSVTSNLQTGNGNNIEQVHEALRITPLQKVLVSTVDGGSDKNKNTKLGNKFLKSFSRSFQQDERA